MVDSGRDVLEALKIINTTNEDLVLDAKYLLENINKETELHKELTYCLENYCQDELICKYCGKDLTTVIEDEDVNYIIHMCFNNECYSN